jgi:hypothetical protein
MSVTGRKPRTAGARSKASKKAFRPVSVRSDARLEEAIRRWEQRSRPLTDLARSSEQLTEDDLAVRINARD